MIKEVGLVFWGKNSLELAGKPCTLRIYMKGKLVRQWGTTVGRCGPVPVVHGYAEITMELPIFTVKDDKVSNLIE